MPVDIGLIWLPIISDANAPSITASSETVDRLGGNNLLRTYQDPVFQFTRINPSRVVDGAIPFDDTNTSSACTM
jgi:hypothetical protein